jgi:hypothetical protein
MAGRSTLDAVVVVQIHCPQSQQTRFSPSRNAFLCTMPTYLVSVGEKENVSVMVVGFMQ